MLGKTGTAKHPYIKELGRRGESLLKAGTLSLAILLCGVSAFGAQALPETTASPPAGQTEAVGSRQEVKDIDKSGAEQKTEKDSQAQKLEQKDSQSKAEDSPASPSAEKKDTASADEAPKRKRRKTELPDVLPCLTWIDPEVEPKAALLCVHGLGLHNDCYEAFGKRMAKLGYIVYAVDMPGFGSFKQAEGRDRVDFDYCKRGLKDTLKLMHKVNPGLPVFILGESMGGAIALRVTSEYPELVDGLISCVPSGDRFEQNKEAIKVGLKLLTSPNKEFNIGSSVIERATQKDDVRKSWSEDILNRMNLTPKELLHFQEFMNENRESAKKISNTPVLFVQGCKDKLVRPEGTMELYNAIACPDRDLKLIRDGEHLIFELGQFDDQVITMVDEWLAAHIDKKKQLGSK